MVFEESFAGFLDLHSKATTTKIPSTRPGAISQYMGSSFSPPPGGT